MLTPDAYLQQILRRITGPAGAVGPGQPVRTALSPTIQQWAGSQLAGVILSGSYAKGTNIVGGTDVDLFISLQSNTGGTLKELYQSLARFMTTAGYDVRRQNVSIGITFRGLQVDLVPGRLQSGYGTDHSIYVSRQDTWQQTNVQTHVAVIGQSGYTDVIRLTKHWRKLQGLEFPSFAVELAVLRALSGRWVSGLAEQLFAVLEFLRDGLAAAALVDPANSNNNVASELMVAEKAAIAAQARSSLSQGVWNRIVW